uniref:Uncharacterized protein MANES_17G003900 n=1 Tax=Rhizophora mucronata TaxID=61149 RepID=A0A2P2M292_RHIMU
MTAPSPPQGLESVAVSTNLIFLMEKILGLNVISGKIYKTEKHASLICDPSMLRMA